MALPSRRDDPFRNFLFQVEVEGLNAGSFSEVAIAEHTTDVIDYRTGDQATHMQRVPGLTKYGDITLKRGMGTGTDELITWRQAVIDGTSPDFRHNVHIRVIDPNGSPQQQFTLLNAWPSKLDLPDFNAKGNDVAILSLTLTHEGVDLG